MNVDRHAYFVGGGIAGLAAAALLISEGGFRGNCIHGLEQSDRFGGNLDGAGDSQSGYVIRGGRMFESHFACTYDLFDGVPSLTSDGMSVSKEIRAFNRRVSSSSKSRLVSGGRKLEAPEFGLSVRDKWDLARLTLLGESTIGVRTIDSYFDCRFFETNFWLMWSTMFAFQPWHGLEEFRRYTRRFMHLLPGFNRLEGIMRTPLNQYDSLVLPLLRWLADAGVELRIDTAVTDIRFADDEPASTVTAIALDGANGPATSSRSLCRSAAGKRSCRSCYFICR
jgi:oleate hydratase